MNRKKRVLQLILRSFSYIVVAAVASCATLFFFGAPEPDKLDELRSLIDRNFIGDVTIEQLNDGAAAGMVSATKDKWSYYIPAAAYADHLEQLENEYVGVGMTISTTASEAGFEILQTEPLGGAHEAGILAGDVLVQVEGKNALELGTEGVKKLIRGDANTNVQMTVLRNGEQLTYTVTRTVIQVAVAQGQMLTDRIGLVSISNFDERCAEESLAAVDSLIEQGATALIFDVRFNPGGFKKELVKVLDRLLPEGPIFRSISYTGEETVINSDAACLELPMAVLINGSSYSAAEFFAAALREYDKAVLVGEATTGKSYFQNTYQLSDGSAVGLSVGKYCTPNGVSLAEVGGLKPDVEVIVTGEIKKAIYAGNLKPEEDPQIQAAIEALK